MRDNMQDYRMKTEVDVHDVDFNGVAKTSSILKYIQTAGSTIPAAHCDRTPLPA